MCVCCVCMCLFAWMCLLHLSVCTGFQTSTFYPQQTHKTRELVVSSKLPEKTEMASSSPSVVIPSSFAIADTRHVEKSTTTPAIFTQTPSLPPAPLPTPLVPSSVTPTGTQQSQSQQQQVIKLNSHSRNSTQMVSMCLYESMFCLVTF